MSEATRRALLSAICAATALSLTSNAQGQPGPLRPDQAFQRLRSLVGDWQGATDGGRQFVVSYRMTANDTALVES